MKYDDASWHYEGDFPENLPQENGATHIGMFLAWCIERDLISDEQKEDSEAEIEEVKSGRMTGREFLINVCDEKFIDDDLNDIGNDFAEDYYNDESDFAKEIGDYAKDYCEVLGVDIEENFYEVENSSENYQLVKAILNKRFEQWQEFVKK